MGESMIIRWFTKFALLTAVSLFFCASLQAESAFERELVVKDQTRKMKVESVFKKLLQAYEDESAADFLELVSDDRFRQDYITFTDALYNDFRTYDIHDVEYWIDRVVSDHVKQFLYVKWEKRFERIDDGRQGSQTGFSRFLFDEVNGKYLLIELAGNPLFGASLKEWRDETPPIAGAFKEPATTNPVVQTCGPENLSACDEFNCAANGGYWYNNQCNSQPQTVTPPDPKCDASNLNLCDVSNCAGAGGVWSDGVCYSSYAEAETACVAKGMFWYNNTCNSEPQGKPDLELTFSYTFLDDYYFVTYTVKNVGAAPTKNSTDLVIFSNPTAGFTEKAVIPALSPGEEVSNSGDPLMLMFRPAKAVADNSETTEDDNRSNNVWDQPI